MTKTFSIRRKIFLVMMLGSMFPIFLFAYFSLNITYSSMYEQLIDSRTMSMDWLNDRLSLMVSSYTEQFYEYEVNKDLRSSIVSWAINGEMNHIDQSRMRKSFETTLSMDVNIQSIEVYSLHTHDGFVSTRASFHGVKRSPDENIWEGRSPESQTNVVFEEDGQNILIKHQLNDFISGKGVAVILIRLRATAMSTILEKVKSSSDEIALLCNDENKILVESIGTSPSADHMVIMEQVAQFEASKERTTLLKNNFYFYESISGGKLRVIYSVPNRILIQPLRKTSTIGVVIIFFGILSAIVLSSIFSRIISKPIVKLSKQMQVTNIQDFNESKMIDRNDEIGYLQESFNIMIHRNKELIANEYQIKLEKRNAQIRALQAQINPHFMHNTLQVIGGMAIKGQLDDIYPVVTSLSDIMRYSFNFSQEMVTLSQEIEYLKDYLSIQNQRFNNRIQFVMSIPDKYLRAYIPKLILQPLLENSFEHALVQKEGEWLIRLNVKQGEEPTDLLISISDNGIGITPEKLEEIRKQLDSGSSTAMSSSSHIGLNNVNSRIRLRYGTRYGLHIESCLGQGTTITIVTRLMLEEDS